jgi:hypothetical protein
MQRPLPAHKAMGETLLGSRFLFVSTLSSASIIVTVFATTQRPRPVHKAMGETLLGSENTPPFAFIIATAFATTQRPRPVHKAIGETLPGSECNSLQTKKIN